MLSKRQQTLVDDLTMAEKARDTAIVEAGVDYENDVRRAFNRYEPPEEVLEDAFEEVTAGKKKKKPSPWRKIQDLEGDE